MGQEELPLGLQIRFPAKTPTHRHVPNLPPIRHSGSAGPVAVVVVAQGRLPVLAPAPAHSPAGSPSAVAVAVARADTGSGPVVRCDVPVAAEDVVDDTDTRSAEEAAACHIHVGQVGWSDSTRLRYLLLEAGQEERDLCSYAQ